MGVPNVFLIDVLSKDLIRVHWQLVHEGPGDILAVHLEPLWRDWFLGGDKRLLLFLLLFYFLSGYFSTALSDALHDLLSLHSLLLESHLFVSDFSIVLGLLFSQCLLLLEALVNVLFELAHRLAFREVKSLRE